MKYQKPNFPLGHYRRQSLFIFGHNRSPDIERQWGNYIVMQYIYRNGKLVFIGPIPRFGGSFGRTVAYKLRKQLRKLYAETNQYFVVKKV